MIHVWTQGREEPPWQELPEVCLLDVDKDRRLKLKVHSFMCSHTFTLTSLCSHLSLISLSLILIFLQFLLSHPSSSRLSSFRRLSKQTGGRSWKFSGSLSCPSRHNLIFCPVTLHPLKPAVSKTLWAFLLSCQGGTRHLRLKNMSALGLGRII